MLKKFSCFYKKFCFSTSDQKLYKILNISQKANLHEVRNAYFQLAKKYHPDINKNPNSTQKFNEIKQYFLCLNY